MKQSMKALLAAAAVSGLLGGASALASVTPSASAAPMLQAGTASFTGSILAHMHKHSCKGKNNCKGQGGCKSGDNGCKGKNSCKGKGGCATNGSKMPG